MRWLNCVTEKSAASEACLPSLPTIPTPDVGRIDRDTSDGDGEKEERTDIGSLDHAHVVPAITDAAHALLGIAPNEPCDICLLRWRTPTRDNSGKFGCDLYKFAFKQVEAELQKREPI